MFYLLKGGAISVSPTPVIAKDLEAKAFVESVTGAGRLPARAAHSTSGAF